MKEGHCGADWGWMRLKKAKGKGCTIGKIVLYRSVFHLFPLTQMCVDNLLLKLVFLVIKMLKSFL